MQKLKSSLTCSYCSKIYKDPIELPCQDLMCKEHLFNKSKIECSTCKQEFEIKDHDFKSIKSIQNIIEDLQYLGDEGKALKKKLEDSIKIFCEMYDEFTLNKTQLNLDCHNHFQEIRFQLDMHREKLKEKIDEIYMEMIEKTKEFETKYLKSFNEKLPVSFKSFEAKSVENYLKELEETFRDPNLVIESIEKLQFKQQEAIAKIQPHLNEMVLIKEDLKASNEFKPFLSFNKDLFGQLNLNEYSCFDPFKSQILSGNQPLELIKLCEFDLKDEFKLLYRANVHGFESNHFHSKCDGHANTLTILKASKSSFIFGGFTSASWGSSDQYKPDQNSFLFSLTNKDNKPCKMKIDPNQHNRAISCHADYGPIFGFNDIEISNNSNTNSNSLSNLGDVYKHSQYNAGTNEAKSFLAGTEKFQLSEIEVYKKI